MEFRQTPVLVGSSENDVRPKQKPRDKSKLKQ